MYLFLGLFFITALLMVVYSTRRRAVLQADGRFCVPLEHIEIKRSKEQRAYLLLTVIFIIIVGTRFELGGSDYFVYQDSYNSIPNIFGFFKDYSILDSKYMTYNHEKGWIFILSFFKTLGFAYNGFLIIHAVFFYLCLYFGLRKYCNNYFIILFTCLAKMFFYCTMVSLRQTTTIAIFFLMLPLIQQKKWCKYFFLTLIALIIHKVAVVLMPVYFIGQYKLTRKSVIIAAVAFWIFTLISFTGFNIAFYLFDWLSPIVRVVLGETAAQKYSGYIAGNETNTSVYVLVEYSIALIFIIFYYNKIIRSDKNAKFIILMFLCLFPFYSIFRNYAFAVRIKDYFVIFYGGIVYYLCGQLKNEKKIIFQAGVIVYWIYSFYNSIYLFDDGHFLVYKTILFNGFFKRIFRI